MSSSRKRRETINWVQGVSAVISIQTPVFPLSISGSSATTHPLHLIYNNTSVIGIPLRQRQYNPGEITQRVQSEEETTPPLKKKRVVIQSGWNFCNLTKQFCPTRVCTVGERIRGACVSSARMQFEMRLLPCSSLPRAWLVFTTGCVCACWRERACAVVHL